MNRSLQYANLLGVAALAVLCVMQWNANRRVNLEAGALEKTRIEQAAQIEQQEKNIKGQAADLDNFREQLALGSAALKEADAKLAKAGREIGHLEAEREQLKASVTNWAAAVTLRDERLKEAGERLQQLATDRNEAVVKFNGLAAKHSETVTALNERIKQFNELVVRFQEKDKDKEAKPPKP